MRLRIRSLVRVRKRQHWRPPLSQLSRLRAQLAILNGIGDRRFWLSARAQRFLHVEAVSGVGLLIAAAVALLWANSRFAESYHTLWHLPLSVGLGEFVLSRSLHFWINDGLMTVFFLVVGMKIRRESGLEARNRAAAVYFPIGPSPCQQVRTGQ
jgi:Na+/H+ antiporter 1